MFAKYYNQADCGKSMIFQYRRFVIFVVSLCYLVLAVLTLIFFNDTVEISGLVFVFINFVISSFLIFFLKKDEHWVFYIFISLVYWLIFVVKAIISNIIGFNNAYILMGIRTIVTNNDYTKSLNIVTFGHILLVFTLLTIPSLFRKKMHYKAKDYLGDALTNKILIFIVAYIAVSSLIMHSLGVAVMGGEQTKLPFRIAGLLFYSRKIALPIFLLYFFEKSIVMRDYRLFNKAFFISLFLAASEIVVRTSKAPLFIFILTLMFLYFILKVKVPWRTLRINPTLIIVLFSIALILFPVIEGYRDIINKDMEISNLQDRISQNLENTNLHKSQNIFVISVERLFNRLVGFTQLCGIVSMNFRYDNINIYNIINYGGIARYYTDNYLGSHHTKSHLASPSLLGFSVILGGINYWYIPFICYLILMIAIWQFSSKLYHTSTTIKCLLGYEIFNTMMAGTIDMSLYRIFLYFVVGKSLDIFIKYNHKKYIPSKIHSFF